MRLKITLIPENRNYEIPLNYQYPLSAAIYKLMKEASPEFTEWLHQVGYKNEKGKPYKMFTFSKLFTNSIDRQKLGKSVLSSSGELSFCFSSAIDDKITLSLVKGILDIGKIKIGAKKLPESLFYIRDVAVLPTPNFEDEASYKSLSPICVSTYDGTKISFLKPDDDSTFKQIAENLKNKYQVLHGEQYDGNIEVIPERNTYKSKLITIKQNTPHEGRIGCFETDIRIKATPKMQELAYNVGIGERNSMGFGCLGVVGKN